MRHRLAQLAGRGQRHCAAPRMAHQTYWAFNAFAERQSYCCGVVKRLLASSLPWRCGAISEKVWRNASIRRAQCLDKALPLLVATDGAVDQNDDGPGTVVQVIYRQGTFIEDR